MRSNYNEKKENKQAYCEAKALKLAQEAQQLSNEGWDRLKQIPFGQPILIGHHSEKSDRSYRNKAVNKIGQSVKLSEKADYYAQKAETIANNNAISNDDPEAIQKIKTKIENITRKHEYMKKFNKKYLEFVKKGDKTDFTGFEENTIKAIKTWAPPYSYHPTPFAHFELTSNTTEIRRLKKRLEHLEKLNKADYKEYKINDIKIIENPEENRVQLFFENKPVEEKRKIIKSNGFRWAHSLGCWQAYYTNWNIRKAKEISTNFNPEIDYE